MTLSSFLLRWVPPFLTVCCLGLTMLIFSRSALMESVISGVYAQSFKTSFLGIILEAFPFILMGVLFSALLQVFVSDSAIHRLTPRHPAAGVLFGSLLGLLFPLCECGMIPVVRRLIRKGMPAYIGIVYIVAGPILNPIVFTSTLTAFPGNPGMAFSRMGLAFAVSVILGFLIYRFIPQDPLKHGYPESASVHISSSGHRPGYPGSPDGSLQGRINSIAVHAIEEFFDMGKYLIFGAFLTASIQSTISPAALLGIASHPWLSHLFMMGFAFLLSLCSTSDAFVAASFTGTFGGSALLAFLVFGPMIDLKSTLMLLSTFKTKIVVWLIVTTAVLVLAGSVIAGKLIS
jgi:uncharacterized membrane protein YraQ (UPF0718 family)